MTRDRGPTTAYRRRASLRRTRCRQDGSISPAADVDCRYVAGVASRLPVLPVLPVLWVCGAPGTGKSTVAWQVLLDLEQQGIRAGCVDIDQLGMVYPPPDGDGDRDLLKAANLEAVIPHHAAAGARVLVVSGVVDVERVEYFSTHTDGFEVTFCQLIVEEAVLRRRIAARGWSTADGDRAVEEMHALRRANLIDTTLDTTACTVRELAAHVRSLVDPAAADAVHPVPDLPPHSALTSAPNPAPDPVPTSVPDSAADVVGPEGNVIVVCGPRAVGTSSVSWAMFMRCTKVGRRTCYLDLEQISFLRGASPTDADRTALRNANVAALSSTAAARGATALIANGTIDGDFDIRGLGRAVHPAQLRVIGLSADSEAIATRIRSRHSGSPARLIGDDLEGASPAHQQRVLHSALDQQARLSRAQLVDEVIDTTDLPLDEVVRRAMTSAGFGDVADGQARTQCS